MVSATDYQLATMKVNLTKLEETVLTFKDTVILQKRFIEQIPLPIIRQNQTIIPERYNEAMKNRLLTNTQANLDDAEALVYQIQQVKEVLPHMKPHYINEIKADYQKPRSVFSILWGLLGTYRGIMTNRNTIK
jgi:hypothetical protein